MVVEIGFWRRLYRIIRANFNHYRYRRLDRIAEKKKARPKTLSNEVGEIIRYSGKPPILIAPSKEEVRKHRDQIHRDRKKLIAKYDGVASWNPPLKPGRFYIDPDLARLDKNDPYNYYHRDT